MNKKIILNNKQVYDLIISIKELQNDNFQNLDPNTIYILLFNLKNLEKEYRTYEETFNIVRNINKSSDLMDVDIEIEIKSIPDIEIPLKYSEIFNHIRGIL